MTKNDRLVSWDLTDPDLHASIRELSGDLAEFMPEIGDVRMVSFDDMVARNIGSDRPKSTDAVYATNRYLIFVEFKRNGLLFEDPRFLNEKEKQERNELMTSVQRKASETLCLYNRFLKDQPGIPTLKTRFLLVGLSPVQEMIAVIARHGEPSHVRTPNEIVKFGIRDNNGTAVFYDEVGSYAASEFSELIGSSLKKGRIMLPRQRDASPDDDADRTPEETSERT